MTQGNKVIWISMVLLIIVLSVWVYTLYKKYSPISLVQQHVPIDRKVYYPGETVGFKIKTCVNQNKYSQVTYQLESDPDNGHYFYILGNLVEFAPEGCWNITDANAQIPADFCQHSIMKPGRHKIYVISSNFQNTSSPPKVYQTDWFEISCSEKL